VILWENRRSGVDGKKNRVVSRQLGNDDGIRRLWSISRPRIDDSEKRDDSTKTSNQRECNDRISTARTIMKGSQ
jgi:hypothetical protein